MGLREVGLAVGVGWGGCWAGGGDGYVSGGFRAGLGQVCGG